MVRNGSIRTKASHVEPSMSPLKCPAHSRVRYVMVKYNTYNWLLTVTDDLWYGDIRMEVKDPVITVLMIIQCLDNKPMNHRVSTLPLTHELYTTPLEFILKMVYELTVHVFYKICCLFTNNNDQIRLKFCTCPCSQVWWRIHAHCRLNEVKWVNIVGSPALTPASLLMNSFVVIPPDSRPTKPINTLSQDWLSLWSGPGQVSSLYLNQYRLFPT